MKRGLLCCLPLLLGLGSCWSHLVALPNVPAAERTESPRFIEQAQQGVYGKVVIRVPTSAAESMRPIGRVTETATSSPNTVGFVHEIEKRLMKAGFSIRDRGLLERALGNSEAADYKRLNELVDTDVIIEVTPRVLDLTTKAYRYADGDKRHTFDAGLSITSWELHYRVVSIQTGEVGVMGSVAVGEDIEFHFLTKRKEIVAATGSGKSLGRPGHEVPLAAGVQAVAEALIAVLGGARKPG